MHPWEEDGVKPDDDLSSLIFCRVLPDATSEGEEHIPVGYVFVIERNRRDPKYKLAGGHKVKGETPQETAQRELKGETGLVRALDEFVYISAEWKDRPSPHWSVLFSINVRVSDLTMMHPYDVENEGEQPEYLSMSQFRTEVGSQGILRPHIKRLVEHSLVLFV